MLQSITQKVKPLVIATLGFLPLAGFSAGTTPQMIKNVCYSPMLAVDSWIEISAVSSSGLKVDFATKTPAICEVRLQPEGTKMIVGLAVGVCEIQVKQPGNAKYQASPPISVMVNVQKGLQLIEEVKATPAKLAVDSFSVLSATTSSELPVQFSSNTPNVCSVAENIVTGRTVGNCVVAANQAGNDNFNPAPAKTKAIPVGKGTQLIGDITFSAANVLAGGSVTVSTDASSELPVTFISSTPTVCGVNGNSIIGIKAGVCTLVAKQSGNENYKPALPKVAMINVVAKLAQAISALTFNPATLQVGGANTIVSAGSDSGLAVNFNSLTPSICSVLNNSVTPISAGTCTIAANQAGNSTYAPAPQKTQSIEIKKSDQTISAFTFNPTTLKVAGTTTISATATSGLAISFSSTTTSICTISGAIISGKAEGNCTITATQPGNSNYNAAPSKTQTILVGPDRLAFEPEMVAIPAGSFLMGSPVSENGGSDERPQHTVNLSAFEIGKYEVTFDEYDAFANDTGRSKPSDSGWGRGKRPVIYVSWNDADAYVQWLSSKTGRNYQLPTEAQWEYAARAGTTTAYWWGDAIGSNKANCWDCGSQWGSNSYYAGTPNTAPVGSFSANPWGVYDTVGNVWEWVKDYYDSSFYSSSEALADDPSNNHASNYRVLRGGSWVVNARVTRAANRNRSAPDNSYNDFGFRVVRLPQE